MGVIVGLAMSVAATIVCAAATAVFCTSTGLIGAGVGALPPQAVRNIAKMSIVKKMRLYIILSPVYSFDTVIHYPAVFVKHLYC
jgi:hypothetical protein